METESSLKDLSNGVGSSLAAGRLDGWTAGRLDGWRAGRPVGQGAGCTGGLMLLPKCGSDGNQVVVGNKVFKKLLSRFQIPRINPFGEDWNLHDTSMPPLGQALPTPGEKPVRPPTLRTKTSGFLPPGGEAANGTLTAHPPGTGASASAETQARVVVRPPRAPTGAPLHTACTGRIRP